MREATPEVRLRRNLGFPGVSRRATLKRLGKGAALLRCSPQVLEQAICIPAQTPAARVSPFHSLLFRAKNHVSLTVVEINCAEQSGRNESVDLRVLRVLD